MMTRAAAGEADPLAIIVACLKQDSAVAEFVGGRVGRVGDHQEFPNAIEIGYTQSHLDADGGDEHRVVTVHVWSRHGSAADVRKVLEQAERAIMSNDRGLSFTAQYSEVRFDERLASNHGILRLSVESGPPADRVAVTEA